MFKHGSGQRFQTSGLLEMALQKPLVWLWSICHGFRKTACTTAANCSNGFWKEAGVCLSCSSPGNMDRKPTERDLNNSCPFPVHTRLRRTNGHCFPSRLFPFGEGDSSRESQPEASPGFILHLLHLSILPHLPRAHLLEIVLLNLTPSSTCVLRQDAPWYACMTTQRLPHFQSLKVEDCV